MGDGYFAHRGGTRPSPQKNVLHWFDEYDDGGIGKGYLGQPSGAAYSVGSNVWRRDFTGGIALVNPDTVARTVTLGGTFRKIKGTQAPALNDGSLVTQVTLPARDGIVLLRDALSDTTAPPAPTGVTATALSTTSIRVSWTASSDASGIKEYRVYSGGALKATVTGTSATVTGLVPSTFYSFSVVAVDNAGNASASSATAIGDDLTLRSRVDTTPPTVPDRRLSASATSPTSVAVSWSASSGRRHQLLPRVHERSP